MKSTHITRLTNPYALDIPEVRGLFEKAFKNDIPAPVDGVLEELHSLVLRPEVLCLIGWEDMNAKGLLITRLPSSKMVVQPQVYHFYNSGSAKLRNKIVTATLDWVKENGYNTLLMANWTGANDKTFERIVSKGNEMFRIGSLYVLELD